MVDLDSVRAQVPHRPLASPPASLLRAQRCRLLRFHELLSTITHASPRDLLRSHFVSVASQIYRVNVCSGISWTSSLRWASAHSASSGTGLGSAQHCACRSKQAVLSLQRLVPYRDYRQGRRVLGGRSELTPSSRGRTTRCRRSALKVYGYSEYPTLTTYLRSATTARISKGAKSTPRVAPLSFSSLRIKKTTRVLFLQSEK